MASSQRVLKSWFLKPRPCGPQSLGEDGFATPAAVVISLAVATVAIAVQMRAVAALHASQSDYARASAELTLDGVQGVAAARLMNGGDPVSGPHWRFELVGHPVEVTYEPETPKLSLAAAAALDPAVLAAMGASQPIAVRSGLIRLASAVAADPGQITSLDSSVTWSRCARTFISPFGAATGPTMTAAGGTTLALQARPGEVWRILARDDHGFADDRTVRFTGDGAVPARIIYRSFLQTRPGGRQCQ